eukprot:g10659.t1
MQKEHWQGRRDAKAAKLFSVFAVGRATLDPSQGGSFGTKNCFSLLPTSVLDDIGDGVQIIYDRGPVNIHATPKMVPRNIDKSPAGPSERVGLAPRRDLRSVDAYVDSISPPISRAQPQPQVKQTPIPPPRGQLQQESKEAAPSALPRPTENCIQAVEAAFRTLQREDPQSLRNLSSTLDDSNRQQGGEGSTADTWTIPSRTDRKNPIRRRETGWSVELQSFTRLMQPNNQGQNSVRRADDSPPSPDVHQSCSGRQD